MNYFVVITDIFFIRNTLNIFLKIPKKLRKNFISGINKILGLTNFNLSEDQISKINTLRDIINLEDFYNHMLSAPTFEDSIIKGIIVLQK